MNNLQKLIREIIQEQKRDRCLRIADRKYDKPSAYKSGAVVRCRKGDIWKGLKEIGDSTSKTYPWELVYKEGNINKDGGYVKYEFKTDSGLEYSVIIRNINKFLDIDFTADGEYDEVNKGELFKVMATITDITKNVISKNQDILGIRYNPKSKGSDLGIQRDQLYRVYISKNIPGIEFSKQGGTIFGIFPKNLKEEEIPGGLAKDLTPKDIAKIHNIDIKELSTKLKQGIKVEMEHTTDPKIAAEIALDHLYEDPKYYEKLKKIEEDESLRKWFKRQGTPGKEGGWVDCNAPIRKDGKVTGYKSCGRKEGEKRAEYPSCRPTAAKCKDKGKGKKWGKTK